VTDIEIPEDTKRSRLSKRVEPADDEIVHAVERFAAFREQHPDGFVDSELVQVIQYPDGDLTYVVQASVWKGTGQGRPDATAFAQGSTKDENPIIAGSPLESADTKARSRALKNMGILADSPKPVPVAPVPAVEPPTIATARHSAGLSQVDLVKRMRDAGVMWTQAVVSRIERGMRKPTPEERAVLTEIIGEFT
jgi:hypothetical protein